MGIVKTSNIGPNDDGPDLNLTSGPGGYVYVNGSIITGSGSVIVGATGATGPQGEQGDPGLNGLIGATGPQGEQGNPGVDGAVAPAGLTWSGVWSGTQSYQINRVVSYNSASWWCKSAVPSAPPILPNNSPDVDTTRWALLATQGPVGPQGIQGPQGERGYTDFSRTYGSISGTQSPNYTLVSYDINNVIYYGRIKLPQTTINDIGKEVVLIISSGNTTNLYTDIYTYDNSIGIQTNPGTTIGMLRAYYGEEYRFTCNGVNDWLCENISSYAHGNQLGGSLHSVVSGLTAGFMSSSDKLILDNITSSTQSLTNKTIVGSTNYVDANGLKTTTDPVYIVATAPSLGQVLMAVSATQATWQTAPINTGPQGATGSTGATGSIANTTSQKTPTDPTITSSTIGVMMGLSASITPTQTGKILIIISGDIDNDTNSRGSRVQIRTGTGSAPINGAALTGSAQGGLVTFEQNNNAIRVPFALNAIENGLTLNTPVWIDISLVSITGGNSRVRDISISVVEL
jgi:hypothetical protein